MQRPMLDQDFYRTAKYANNLRKQVMIDTTEEFKPYPKNEDYMVSNKGRVYSYKSDAIMNPFPNQQGYLQVNVNRVPTKIHKLVAETFLVKPNDPKYTDINHKDGIKYHNEVENLEYCTRSQNIQHAYDHKLEAPKNGVNNGRSTMAEEDATRICEKLEKGKTYRQIAEEMGWEYNAQSKHRISNIKTKNAWTYLSKNYNF